MKTILDHPRYYVTEETPSRLTWHLKGTDIEVSIYIDQNPNPGQDQVTYSDPRWGRVTHPSTDPKGVSACLFDSYLELGKTQVEGLTDLDGKDQAIVKAAYSRRMEHVEPMVGDWVGMSDGTQQRFSHDWGDLLQTSTGGSFYLLSQGGASFSGGLNPGVSKNQLELTDELRPGRFWIFHHGRGGAGRGVHFTLPCKVWKQVK